MLCRSGRCQGQDQLFVKVAEKWEMRSLYTVTQPGRGHCGGSPSLADTAPSRLETSLPKWAKGANLASGGVIFSSSFFLLPTNHTVTLSLGISSFSDSSFFPSFSLFSLLLSFLTTLFYAEAHH